MEAGQQARPQAWGSQHFPVAAIAHGPRNRDRSRCSWRGRPVYVVGEEMMSDPISRLEFARQEIDRVFGSGHAQQHPELASKLSVEFNRPVTVEVSEDGE